MGKLPHFAKWRTRTGEVRWKAKIFISRDGNGKQKYLSKCFGTKSEAEVWAAQQTTNKASGTLTLPSRTTVGEFLQQWLRDYAQGAVALTTFASYKMTVDVHLTPSLGGIHLSKLSPQRIQNYLTERLTSGLSSTTVRHHFMLLHKVLDSAVKWGHLPLNPCDRCDPPRQAEFEATVLDQEQSRLFLGKARKSPFYGVYLFAALGLRAGEILGLRWEDVNLTLGAFTIRQKFYRLGKELLFNAPKSKSSRRTIPLPQEHLGVLRRLQEEQKAHKDAFGDAYHDHGLVFCQPNGKPIHLHNLVGRDFRPLLKEAKLPRLRFHDLRHSAASILIAMGTDLVTVSHLLGHGSGAGFTLKQYAHLLPGTTEAAIGKLEVSLFSNRDASTAVVQK